MGEEISVLFLDSDKEKIWETDYILDSLLKSIPYRSSFSLNGQSGETLQDILVFNCRKNKFEDVLRVVKKTNPKVIIQLSDEYIHEDLNHYNRLAKYCNLFVRQYHHEGYQYFENTIHMPLGYCNDVGLNFLKYLPEDMNSVPKIKDRIYNWSFYGDMKSDRWEMLEKYSNLPSHSYGTHAPKDTMVEKYLQSIFVPCGRGNSTLNCYRLYEASMCGAIPCVVGSVNEISETFKYEDNPPWIFGTHWDNVVHQCKVLLQDQEKLQEMQNNVLEWWEKRVLKVSNKISEYLEHDRISVDDIEDEMMIDHYWQDDNIFDENWFSYQNLYRNAVKNAKDGDVFVEVGAWKGRSTSFLAVEIANSKKDIKLFVVDTWEDEEIYQKFLSNMKPVEKYYFPLRLNSKDAFKKFRKESVDFVFLDASESYEDVKEDITNWLPKVKKGGILAGHDYYPPGAYDWFPGVKQAVDEMLGYKIPMSLNYFEMDELCFIYHKEKDQKHKFEDFPSVNFISVTECEDRRNLLYEKFEKYGITNVTPHIYDRYIDEDHQIESELLHRLSIGSRGPVTSHLKAIKEWYNSTDEPYTIICEDDLGFQTVKYWNFTWKDFFNSLPHDWGCVQLCILREEFYRFNIGFRGRCFCDWSGCAYLISRLHAKKLIDAYYKNDVFTLNYVGEDMFVREEWAKIPVIETIIYSDLSKVYCCPLFVEDVVNCPSSYFNAAGIRTGETNFYHEFSYEATIDWWKNHGSHMNVNQLKCN